MQISRALVTTAVGAALAIGPAVAAHADHNFETPSGNISCEYNSYSNSDGDSVQAMGCILYDINLGSQADEVCADEPDRVVGFLLARTGRTGYGCFDPNEFEEAVVLQYGQTFRRAGIVCSSKKTGLTCTNVNKHGFAISRASQRIF